jgi:biopolymer transport protein ExbD
MAVHLPGRHPAFPPIGILRKGHGGGKKKSLMMPLNLTAMVDMFTCIVIFLLQSFSASGELMFMQKDLKLPEAGNGSALEERGPVVTLFHNEVLIEGQKIAALEELDDTLPTIPDLTEKLKKMKENDLKYKGPQDPTKPYEGHMIVQSDKTTDFELVRKSIGSMNEAGWTHIQFAVMPLAGDAPSKEGGEE